MHFNRYISGFELKSIPREKCDVLVLGSGVAGLSTAYWLARSANITIVTKANTEFAATALAQGGIASALHPTDHTRIHFEDTMRTGRDLCEKNAVKVLVEEGPKRLIELVEEIGADFDSIDGNLALTLEGGHTRPRIAHAQGDATGSVVERSLTKRLKTNRKVRILEDCFAIDILTDEDGFAGLLIADPDYGFIRAMLARVLVLATGGMGQVFSVTTNPLISTGDGFAMALRAGAELADIEFIQYHPTALHFGENPRWLISEAVRGEGAKIADMEGEHFMKDHHEMADLAPRDAVVRAMISVMSEQGTDHLYLDARDIPSAYLKKRFPSINKYCLERGMDITKDLIPVSPAAHYMCGGIVANDKGKTRIRGVYACGEVANAGVHGANRLASNSLLEGLVFGKRIAESVAAEIDSLNSHEIDLSSISHSGIAGEINVDHQTMRSNMRKMMSEEVGIGRDKDSLSKAVNYLKTTIETVKFKRLEPRVLELINMMQLSYAISLSCLSREESRGCHFRKDYPTEMPDMIHHQVLFLKNGKVQFEKRDVGDLSEYSW